MPTTILLTDQRKSRSHQPWKKASMNCFMLPTIHIHRIMRSVLGAMPSLIDFLSALENHKTPFSYKPRWCSSSCMWKQKGFYLFIFYVHDYWQTFEMNFNSPILNFINGLQVIPCTIYVFLVFVKYHEQILIKNNVQRKGEGIFLTGLSKNYTNCGAVLSRLQSSNAY